MSLPIINASSINAPIARATASYVRGLTTVWASATTIVLNPGRCSDSKDKIDMVIPTTTTDINGNVIPNVVTINAATNGILGLDAGTFAANTFYYTYVIGSSSGFFKTSAILSASATQPTMPYGYDSFKKVSINVTGSGASFLLTYIVENGTGRTLVYDSPIALTGVSNATSFTAISNLANYVAPVGNTLVTFIAKIAAATAGNSLYLRPTNSSYGPTARLSSNVVTVPQYDDLTCLAMISSGSESIDYYVTQSTDNATLAVKSFTYNV